MSLQTKHRAIDGPLIAEHRDTFIELARDGYANQGRGIVSYRAKEDDATYIPARAWEAQKDNEEVKDALRMLRDYLPESEFVICVIHKDGTVALYRLAYPKD